MIRLNTEKLWSDLKPNQLLPERGFRTNQNSYSGELHV
jgi:hypothetical protein